MKLSATDTLGGLPALLVRDALRFRDWTSASLLASRLHLSPGAADALLGVLLAEGLIVAEKDNPGVYGFTVSGNALRMAHALRPIPRAKADALVAGLLERVAHVNASSDFIVRVDTVHAFGSYITTAPLVNDIDLVIAYADKHSSGDRAERAVEHARRSGRHFSTFVDELFWPERQVRLFLKNRSPRLSLHSREDRIVDRVRMILLFPTAAVASPHSND